MNRITCLLIALLCAATQPGAVRAETNLDPVLVSLLGKVTVSSGAGSAVSAAEHQALPMGSKIATIGGSAALITVVPGIKTKLKGKTAVLLKNAQVSSEARKAEVELIKGNLLCHVKKQGSLKQKYRVDTGVQEWMEATSAMWEAGVLDNEHTLAVLAGTVFWSRLPDPGELKVSAGSVLIADYEARQEENVLVSVKIVNLVDGSYTFYPLNGASVETSPATAAQLSMARGVFSDALGNQFDNLGSDQKSALLSLIYDANRTLALAGVAPISATAGVVADPATNTGTTAAAAKSVTSINPQEATSPITP